MSGETIYFYGGLKGEDSVKDIFKFNVKTNCWSQDSLEGDLIARDDHAIACQENGDFYVFGGFVDGSRVNQTCVITRGEGGAFKGEMCSEGGDIPVRAGHSTVLHNGALYTFGGQDDDNNKLDDVWMYDVANAAWTLCAQEEGALKPTPRCGHTATVCDGKMYVFGGILELTKELNDLCIFDIATQKWEQAPQME